MDFFLRNADISLGKMKAQQRPTFVTLSVTFVLLFLVHIFDFFFLISETFQPLLMTPGRGATVPLGLQPQQQPPPRSLNLNGLKKEAALEAVSSLEKDNPKLESPCCRYRKPFTVSLISVGLIMFITFLVLYWNYYETIHRYLLCTHWVCSSTLHFY